MTKRKNDGRAMTLPGGLAVGTAVSMAMTLALSLLLAKLLHNGVLRQNQTGYGVMALLLTASFLGAATAQGKVKHLRGMVCLLEGLLYFLMLLCVTALFFGGQYSGMGVSALVVLAGSGTAALLLGRGGKGGPKRRGIRRRDGVTRK